jgi:hypothetical protein
MNGGIMKVRFMEERQGAIRLKRAAVGSDCRGLELFDEMGGANCH